MKYINFTKIMDDFDKELSKIPTLSKNYLTSIIDLNYREDANNYYIDFALSGMSKEDVSISVVNDLLTITGSKNEKSEFYAFHKDFSKKIRISDDINTKNISADMKNGVLTVTLPKKVVEVEKINIEIK
jgi:HSP20 family protein